MATITEVFARTSLPTIPGSVLYEIDPAAASAVVTNILVVNTSQTTQTFTILLDGVEVFSETEIAGNSTISMDLKQALYATTGEITGSASSTAVKLHMSGVVII